MLVHCLTLCHISLAFRESLQVVEERGLPLCSFTADSFEEMLNFNVQEILEEVIGSMCVDWARMLHAASLVTIVPTPCEDSFEGPFAPLCTLLRVLFLGR
eukprot:314903-Amphidinium_carterae.1